ncbi:uncharacterized protein MYCGRDRAFT_110052 [Zymoseptoria tritici IPO323]|uniref:Uncharacterized protein n=1 Tax=Zymoseptoria tritici (strain CBS 115943 / IPO323) TaxID=336722 RepID=F9XGE6_ZYMTI|nr:uncharacterized protein MYCGRDRAFT_110052 [Zymoseptoria tritici IPO323]EGP86280.1 hypothetical protein MYCGRDRAFT_110052 [Zymoseptoria tritici IPO323]
MWSLPKIGLLAPAYVLVFPAYTAGACLDHWHGTDHPAKPFGHAAVKRHEAAMIQKRDIISYIRLALTLRLIAEGFQGACDNHFGLLARGDGSGGLDLTVGPTGNAGANWLDTTIVIDPDSASDDAPRRIGYLTHAQYNDADSVTAHYSADETQHYMEANGYPQNHEFFIEIQYSIEEQR